MPNFQTLNLKEPLLPYKLDDIIFEWKASWGNESLILTNVANETFFIKQICKNDKFLIKGDKLSKPTLVKTLQKALIAYEKVTNSKPIYSNTQSNKNRQEEESDILKNIDFFAQKFRAYQEHWENCWIEVGFGSGRHLLHQAKTNPNILHVGIEIHKPSIEQVIKQCKLQNINNILIIDYDARVLMEFFASNSVGKIFVHFPIPWDKKPHRRVISEDFTKEAIRVLEVGGKLEVRTDSDIYFHYTFETFTQQNQVSLEIYKNKDIAITSKYEQRWKNLEKNIYDIILTNSEYSYEKETPKPLYFFCDKNLHVNASSIKKETILHKKWFVHFETCYTIDEKNFIWKVAFGDTSHVEHCYLMIREGKVSYFPRNIYATKNNTLAHQAICERLVS